MKSFPSVYYVRRINMEINEKEKRLMDLAKIINITVEARGERKEYGKFGQGPIKRIVTYKVIIEDD